MLAKGTLGSNRTDTTGSKRTLASYIYTGYRIKEKWVPYLRIYNLDFQQGEGYYQQEKILLKNYNNEMQNLANTVALGVNITVEEQNFEGVGIAMDFVREGSGMKFVSMLQYDSVWNSDHS